MGKGSNVNKKMQAQLRNQKDKGKTDAERKAASEKAKYVLVGRRDFENARAHAVPTGRMPMRSCVSSVDRPSWSTLVREEYFVCFLENTVSSFPPGPPLLYQHVIAKHPAGTDLVSCFDQLAGFDPNDPKGEKTTTTETAAAKPKKTVKKADADLDALLDAGLGKGKKK